MMFLSLHHHQAQANRFNVYAKIYTNKDSQLFVFPISVCLGEARRFKISYRDRITIVDRPDNTGDDGVFGKGKQTSKYFATKHFVFQLICSLFFSNFHAGD